VGFLLQELKVDVMKSSGKSKIDGLPTLAGILANLNPDNYSGLKRKSLEWLRFAGLVIKDFLDNRCFLHASALSFSSILSIVPFFALAFAVLKGLGVHNFLEPIIIDKLAAGSPEIVDRVITYIDNTKMGSVGAMGLAALIFTVITLLGNIEQSFNDIWGVKETRSLNRKFSDYLSVIIIGPLLLLAATSITSSLQSQELVRWLINTEYVGGFILFLFKCIPYLSIWIALIFLYIFMPNTRVRFSSALVGGVLAGTIWQIAQWGYIHFQVGVAKYNAIYGALSALPVFMVWIYTSWLIVMFGIEIVYAHQNRTTFLNDMHHPFINHAAREMTALLILHAAANSYYHDKPPWTCERLAGEFGLPIKIVQELLTQLIEKHYLIASEGESPVYYPARALEHMSIAKIQDDLKNCGGSYRIKGMVESRAMLQDLLERMKTCAAPELAGITMKDLVSGADGEDCNP
jgi:membrane protein